MKLYQEGSHETHGPGALLSDDRERERERERERQTESKVDAADTWKKDDKARMEPLASLYEALRL